MDLGFRLEGVDELLKAIDASERRFDAALNVAVRSGARVILKAYKTNLQSHKQTGELEKHAVARRWKRKPGFVGYLVGPKFPGTTPQQISYYGDWLEKGHRKARPGKRLTRLGPGEREAFALEHGSSMVRAYPTLRPAFDNNISLANAKMEKVLMQAIDGKIPESDALAILGELI